MFIDTEQVVIIQSGAEGGEAHTTVELVITRSMPIDVYGVDCGELLALVAYFSEILKLRDGSLPGPQEGKRKNDQIHSRLHHLERCASIGRAGDRRAGQVLDNDSMPLVSVIRSGTVSDTAFKY